ncbi:MAG: transposase, partial [Pirellulales bacterium]
MMRTKPTIHELDLDELQDIVRHAEAKQFNDKDYETVKVLAESYVHLAALLQDKNISIGRLRKMLFGASTEKTAAVTGNATDSAEETDSETSPETDPSASRKGHGRNGADAYRGAEKIQVPHESLQPGDACPECGDGTVYETTRPGVLVRITGQAPVAAKVYQLQKLRCHLCGKVFTAQSPPGVGATKYDATAGSMIALMKYGSGMPFNRFGGLQGTFGIPLPASTQWDIVNAQAKQIEPIHAELIRQAGQGDVVYNDDTTIKILELMGKRARQNALAEDSADGNAKKKERTGLFTSGVVSTGPASGCPGRRIALFFSGRKHPG